MAHKPGSRDSHGIKPDPIPSSQFSAGVDRVTSEYKEAINDGVHVRVEAHDHNVYSTTQHGRAPPDDGRRGGGYGAAEAGAPPASHVPLTRGPSGSTAHSTTFTSTHYSTTTTPTPHYSTTVVDAGTHAGAHSRGIESDKYTLAAMPHTHTHTHEHTHTDVSPARPAVRSGRGVTVDADTHSHPGAAHPPAAVLSPPPTPSSTDGVDLTEQLRAFQGLYDNERAKSALLQQQLDLYQQARGHSLPARGPSESHASREGEDTIRTLREQLEAAQSENGRLRDDCLVWRERMDEQARSASALESELVAARTQLAHVEAARDTQLRQHQQDKLRLEETLRYAQDDLQRERRELGDVAAVLRSEIAARDTQIAALMQTNFSAAGTAASQPLFWSRDDFSNKLKDLNGHISAALDGIVVNGKEQGLYDMFQVPTSAGVWRGVNPSERAARAFHWLWSRARTAAQARYDARSNNILDAAVSEPDLSRDAALALRDESHSPAAAALQHGAKDQLRDRSSFIVFQRTVAEWLFVHDVPVLEAYADRIVEEFRTKQASDSGYADSVTRILSTPFFVKKLKDMVVLVMQMSVWSRIANGTVDVELRDPSVQVPFATAMHKCFNDTTVRVREGDLVYVLSPVVCTRAGAAALTADEVAKFGKTTVLAPEKEELSAATKPTVAAVAHSTHQPAHALHSGHAAVEISHPVPRSFDPLLHTHVGAPITSGKYDPHLMDVASRVYGVAPVTSGYDQRPMDSASRAYGAAPAPGSSQYEPILVSANAPGAIPAHSLGASASAPTSIPAPSSHRTSSSPGIAAVRLHPDSKQF